MDRDDIRRTSPEEIRAWARRWSMVAERQREELLQATPAQKFEALAALMSVARAMGGRTVKDEERVDEVRRRWGLLIEHGGG